MEAIMNAETQWDGVVDTNKVEGPIERFVMKNVSEAVGRMRNGNARGRSGIVKEHFTASQNGKQVILEIANEILNGSAMSKDWGSIGVPIYKKKGSVMVCRNYRGAKLLEHGMKVVERLLEKRLRDIVKIDRMQFGFMPGKETLDAIFIATRMQEKFIGKSMKLLMCFVDLEKAFDRVSRKVIEWTLRKRAVPEVLVQAVMNLYKDAKTRVPVGNGYSEDLNVSVSVHQGSVLSPFLFATVLDVLSEEGRKGDLYGLLYADDLVLKAETMEELEVQVKCWKTAFEGKDLKVNMDKSKNLECSTGTSLPVESKIDPLGVCGRRAKTNCSTYKTCQKWVHVRCAKVKKVTD